MSEKQNQKPNSDKNPRKDDDRNLVQLSDDDIAGDFDDRMWLFWERNKGGIIFGIIGAVVVLTGVEIFKYVKEQAKVEVQQAYIEALENEQLPLFAIDYPDSPLAGLVWLRQADDAYTEGDFKVAAEQYQQAANNLKDLPLGTRAQIGYGMTLYKQDNISSARNALAKVTTSTTAMENLRAEAHYHLAVIALAQDEPETALTHIDAISTLAYAGTWSQRAEMLRMNAPELNKPSTSSKGTIKTEVITRASEATTEES